MLMNNDLLGRIAGALERLAPPPLPHPRDDAPAYAWHRATLREAPFGPLSLDLLTGIDDQKAMLLDNTRRLAAGNAAHDALLWGARGSGKSALVKGCVAAVQAEGSALALVEVAANELASLPELFTLMEGWSRPAVLFIDDLAFDDSAGIAAARGLRSVLDGGSTARPPHVRLYVTSNRRHIVSRDMAEQDSAINVRDVIDDRLALADRFGLSLGFHVCDQDAYVAMVRRYAEGFDLPFDAQDAIGFATRRGARSGRIAWHYVVDLAGRNGRSLPKSARRQPPSGS